MHYYYQGMLETILCFVSPEAVAGARTVPKALDSSGLPRTRTRRMASLLLLVHVNWWPSSMSGHVGLAVRPHSST